MTRITDDAARRAWAEEDFSAFEDENMKPQPDMAQMPLDYSPVTWREWAHDFVMLAASCAAALGVAAGAWAIVEAFK